MNNQETIIVHPKTSEEYKALRAFLEALDISFETSGEKTYAPEFVTKIQKSKGGVCNKKVEDKCVKE